MATCLGKSCSFFVPRVPFVNCCQFMYLVIEDRIWDLIVSVPDLLWKPPHSRAVDISVERCCCFHLACIWMKFVWNSVNWSSEAFLQTSRTQSRKAVRSVAGSASARAFVADVSSAWASANFFRISAMVGSSTASVSSAWNLWQTPRQQHALPQHSRQLQ